MFSKYLLPLAVLVHAQCAAQREIIYNCTLLVNNMEQQWLYHQK